MDALVFSMSGEPRGKGRPRAAVRGGFARMYTDPKTRKYEASIAKIARVKMGARPPFEGPLSVSLRFRIELPKSMPKYRRARVLAGEEAHTGGPDVDNMAKAVLDAMNGIVFPDDRQIVRLFATKIGAVAAGVDIRIEPLAPQAADMEVAA